MKIILLLIIFPTLFTFGQALLQYHYQVEPIIFTLFGFSMCSLFFYLLK